MALQLTPNQHTVSEGTYEDFRYELIDAATSNAVLKIHVPPGESVRAVPGCMLATSAGIDIKGKLRKTARAMLGPEESSYQMLTAAANGNADWVLLSPDSFGAITPIELHDGEPICVGDNSFLAALGEVESSTRSQGVKKALFSGHGLFIKKLKGSGVAFVSAIGAIMTLDIADGETVVVDNGHLVTWPASMQFDIVKASGGMMSTVLSGEGWVLRMHGPGRVRLQTRNAEQVAKWVYSSARPPSG